MNTGYKLTEDAASRAGQALRRAVAEVAVIGAAGNTSGGAVLAHPLPDAALPRMAGKDGGGNRRSPGRGPGDGDGRTGLVTKTRPKTKKPSLYRVVLLNDDYTPMEFVVHVLEKYFAKSREDATRIMLMVHHKGAGICGVYTYEVAETKVTQVIDFARQNGHPLQCTMEKE